MKVCCFTGHRTIKSELRGKLITRLDGTLERLISEGYTEFRAGGARGFDTLAALRVLYLRSKHPDVRLCLYLPCRDQTKGWPKGEQLVWEDILSRADEVHYVCDTYHEGCMHARNRALVDGSDLCIAYLTQNRGGTLYTCAYALKNGVELLNLGESLA
ncbi:MAG: DUF1273 family protein [Clostridia bacterium]|nr:DUF1273 family protein [Clostridia bacterium]